MSTHQANMFKLVLQSEDREERIMMVKRVVPKELPAKTGDRIIVIIIVVAVIIVIIIVIIIVVAVFIVDISFPF